MLSWDRTLATPGDPSRKYRACLPPGGGAHRCRWNVGAAVIVCVGGRITDITGRRWFLMFGAIAAAVAALIGALGQSIDQMIASGIIFGIGGGFQELCFACAQELVPKKWRFQTLGMRCRLSGEELC